MHSVTRIRLRRAALLTCISAGAGLLAYATASAAPHTPAPHTPAPHTPTPHTPAPHTPAPHTPAPHTPAPHTPAPHTPAPHTPAPHTSAPHTPAPRWRPGAFNWLGTFALAGSGFPEGTRHASMTVRRDSAGYQLDVSGPPGRLASVHIAGDSAHIVWDFEAGTDPMRLALRGFGDSISGTWTIGSVSGAITGARMLPRTP
jgi:hypothetical protein